MAGGNVLEEIGEGKYENSITYSKDTNRAYRAEEGRLVEQFQKDLEDEFGTGPYVRKDEIFRKAWADGHSEGFEAVYFQYQELMELIDLSSLTRVGRPEATL